MAESSDQSSGFWTLTRPSKLSKRRNSDLHELHHKVFNVAVVGLSGTERDKGPIGIGKSCLCNRFVRSAADDYYTDHISVLSQSDFNGRVVNNDHWLYWGSVIKSGDGYDLAFNVIEQSEFIDDVCFQPFKSGKTELYYKRCANTKLVSPEKLMYICKNQLGIEREYEQSYLPDGKFSVDGFLCLFDVSEVQGRSIDKQIEITNLIMLNLIKTRKPIVFVTTKHDEASEVLVAEAERLVNQSDFRGFVPIVETSAQENVNINTAFLICAQLIDKTRAKLRVMPYFEAYKNHQDLLNVASEAYINLIRATVIDYRSSWQQVCMKLSHNPEFLQYTYLHGLDKASLVFKNHTKQLHNESINQKVQSYLRVFPDILNEIVTPNNPGISSNNNDNSSSEVLKFTTNPSPQAWELAKEYIRSHPSFNKYFIQIPEGISWYDTELLQSTENRIPSDWLDSNDAYIVFQQRNLRYEIEQKRHSTKELFAQMLSNLKVPVGKPFIELKHLFSGNHSLEILSDQELFEIYVEYQNNLLQQARADFQELLLENAEHLHHLTSSDRVIRQDDIKTINAILQHDERYQALDRFDQDRTLMMIRHLSFLHSQISEQCPSYPKCVEPEIERLLITKAKTLVSRFFETRDGGKAAPISITSHKTCDLVIFGTRRPSQQLILALNVLNSRAAKASQYQITFTVFDNADDVDTQLQRFRQSNTQPKGCFCIFTNQRSLEHVRFTLEKFLMFSAQVQNDKSHFGGPPIVMLYAADITLDERTMLALENEGQQMADRFKCPFMNVTAIDQYRQHQQNSVLKNDHDSVNQVMSECASLDYACVDAAFNVLKEAISRRVCFMELYNNQDLIPRQAFSPDARILMCLLCGEPFSNELFMWKMFLDYDDCYVISSKSICLKIKLENGLEKFVEITITSYTHGAFNYREDLLHGFILVCSSQRKASLSILNAFSFNIPCTPVLVMAIMNEDLKIENNHAQADETDSLIEEARSAANRLKGYFELLDIGHQASKKSTPFGIKRIEKFLHTVIKRKPIIERAYELGDNECPTTVQSATSSGDYEDEPLGSSERQGFKMTNYTKDRVDFKHRKNHGKTDHFRNEDGRNDSNGCSVDMNFNEESEAYSNHSAVATAAVIYPPKPSSRLSKRSNLEELQMLQNEMYAKRPLPPIPVSADQQLQPPSRNLESVRDVGLTTTSLSGNKSLKHEDAQTVATSVAKCAEEPINDSNSSDGDTEDSSGNKLDKPKPGKLDLRQFDNITTAIGKLNVQPTNPTNIISKPVDTTPNTRRISSTRKNQVRAVAPPQLPTANLLPKVPKNRLNALVDEQVTEHQGQTANDEGAIDFSQSPIAQRLLKHSKDHKVSELNSPYGSDSELPTQGIFSVRGQKLFRAGKSLSSDNNNSSPSTFKNSSIDSSELISSRGATIKQLNEILAKPPTRPGGQKAQISREQSTDLQQEETTQQNAKKGDKDSKKDKKKLRSDEKLEKQRLKEEERLRRQEKKLAAKKSKSTPGSSTVDDDGIPLFIKRCIEFIEAEGLDAEGIYRVPGNRAHVDAFVQKFKENPDMSILESDIPVNAVATALKDFLSKKWGPIIPLNFMNELTELSSIAEREKRTQAVRQLVKKLPQANYRLLKYVFSHFVKVSLNHSLNSMDSKNLAICWWPTLLPLHFSDMVMFEQMRPHLEESIQTMIDQYDFIFDSQESSPIAT